MKKRNLKQIPKFRDESEEQDFWASHEIVDFVDTRKPIKMDLSQLKPSTQTVTLRMSKGMVEDLKTLANKNDIPYQSLIKVYLSEKIQEAQKWK